MITARPLKVGIISANWGAQAHLPAWRKLDGVEVVAMCTSRRETAEAAIAKYAIPRPFWDYEAMCADPDIDIIDIGTSPLQREAMVTAALNSGKHVVNQLPFASSADAAERLVTLQRARRCVGSVDSSMTGMAQVAFIKEMLDEGDFGEVMQVHCSWQMSYFLPPIPGFAWPWFGKAGLGVGVARNQGSHLLHLLRHLFGPVAAVIGRAETRLAGWEPGPGEWIRNETDDTLQALVRFETELTASLATSWAAIDSPGFSLDIFGTKQRVRLTDLRYPGVSTATLYRACPTTNMEPSGEVIEVPGRFHLVAGHDLRNLPGEDPIAGPQLPSLARLFASTKKAILDGGEPMVSFERALHVQRVVSAMYRSHQEERWVTID